MRPFGPGIWCPENFYDSFGILNKYRSIQTFYFFFFYFFLDTFNIYIGISRISLLHLDPPHVGKSLLVILSISLLFWTTQIFTTVTNTREIRLKCGKSIVVMVSEVSIHGWLPLLLLSCGEARQQGREFDRAMGERGEWERERITPLDPNLWAEASPIHHLWKCPYKYTHEHVLIIRVIFLCF